MVNPTTCNVLGVTVGGGIALLIFVPAALLGARAA